jgi:hypothetical protein
MACFQFPSRTSFGRELSTSCCNKIAEAEAAVSVNKQKWLVMHMHVQLQLDELRGPPKPLAQCDMKVPGQLLPRVAAPAGLKQARCLNAISRLVAKTCQLDCAVVFDNLRL